VTDFKDLTLREGSQTPGLEIDEATGLRVVEALAALDVSCVELSFPRASPREPWYRRAEELDLRTAALARATAGDVEAALAVAPDEVELLVTASDIQREHVLGETREAARERLTEHVELHTAAMLDEPRTFEAFDPAVYGGERELLFGANTGRGAARAFLADAGIEPSEERAEDVLDALAAAAEERDGPLGEAEARELVRDLA
jgi:isopropylmalate/homocitrate/citramalate synthase